jgi:hypothetical protein
MLSKLGEKNKAIREDKRRLKKTLYYLLEIRYHLKLFETDDETINTLYAMIKNKLGNIKDIQELSKENFKLAARFFIGILKDNKPEITKRDIEHLSKNYMQCVENLSEVDPILAFRLKGKENVQQLLKEILDGTKSSILEYTKNVNDVTELEKAMRHFEPKILRETLRELESILVEIAKQISRSILKQTRERISNQGLKRNESEIEGIFDRIMEGYLPAS